MPGRGDIAVLESGGELLVKRVIGLPEDELCIEGGVVYVNGCPLDEPYVHDPDNVGADYGTITVPEGCVFVLGDNRGVSRDSRSASVGCVPLERIMATMSFRIWRGHG